MTNPILDKIKAELVAIEEKKKAMLAEIQKEFPTMFIDLFRQAPNLKSYSWKQYTPYFNDGDSCEFSAHVEDGYINGYDSEYEDAPEGETTSIQVYNYKKLETEEDVRINKEVAEKAGYTWYASTQIGQEGLCYNPDYDELAAEAVKQIREVLTVIPEEFLRDLFGDHCIVTLYADGKVEVEDYDHD